VSVLARDATHSRRDLRATGSVNAGVYRLHRSLPVSCMQDALRCPLASEERSWLEMMLPDVSVLLDRVRPAQAASRTDGRTVEALAAPKPTAGMGGGSPLLQRIGLQGFCGLLTLWTSSGSGSSAGSEQLTPCSDKRALRAGLQPESTQRIIPTKAAGGLGRPSDAFVHSAFPAPQGATGGSP
jgi:hypothetical protein